MKTRANLPEDPGPDSPDKEPLKIRIEFVDQDKGLTDLQGCLGIVVFCSVAMVLVVMVAVHEFYEMLEPLFEVLDRLVRWVLGE